MTFAQKMLDERKMGYAEGLEEGRIAGLRETILAFKGVLEPSVIAEKLKMSLEQVIAILSEA